MPTKKVVTTSRKATPGKASVARATRKTAATAVLRPSDEEIRLRAYQLFLERDGQGGDPHSDWLRAESELVNAISVMPTATKSKTARAAARVRSAS